MRDPCSMAANEVMHSIMVSRPGVSGLLLVAGSHLFGEQTRRERLERRDVLQAPWVARRDQPPPTTDDPALWYNNNVALSTFLIPLHLFTWTCWGYSNVWGSAWIGCTGFCIVTAVPQVFPCGSVGLLNPSQASVTVQCGAHVS